MADTALIFNIIARDKTGDGFSKVKAGAAAAGAAAGAVLMSAIGTAMEKSRIDSKVAAQLGATPAQAAQIGKLSGAVYAAGFGEDMTQVGAAIKAGAQNGLLDLDNMSKEAAQKVTSNLLTVGTLMEEDTERVSAAVSQMLKTGLADSSQEAMDILVNATQNGVNKSQDLLDTVNEYGTQFRKVGLDGQTSLGLISQALKAGARDSDTVADAIKEFSIRAIDGSKSTTAAYKALGMDAKGMAADLAAGGDRAKDAFSVVLSELKGIEDPVKRNAIAVGLFGTKAEDLGDALYAMDVDTAAKSMGKMAGATDRAAATAANGAAGWGTLGRQFQMALVDTLNEALPVVNAVFGFMQRNQSWVKPLAVGLTFLAVAIGVVTVATWAWGIAIAVTPIGWILIGIVALIAVIVLIATKTTWFQTIWQAVWGFMKMVGAWFAGPFANFFVATWKGIVAGAMWLKNQIMFHVNAIKSGFVALGHGIASVWNGVTTKGNQVVTWIKNMPGKVKSSLSNMFSPLWTGFRGMVNRIIGGWNNLSFSIGGGSFMGVNVPSVSFGTPNIPYLASGGDVQRTGLAVVHQGERITKAAVARRTGPGTGTGGGGGGATIRITGGEAKVIRVLLELLRDGIRDQGGDPVKVLTPR